MKQLLAPWVDQACEPRSLASRWLPPRRYTGLLAAGVIGGAVLTALLAGGPVADATEKVSFTSGRAAFSHGFGAFKAGHHEIAIPGLEFAASRDVFGANFYLAKIYSDNNSAYTDHGRAFRLFRKVVIENLNLDPADVARARIASASFTAIGRYLLTGISTIGLKPNMKQAVEYFTYSANVFDDEGAQFELAKLKLTGDGVRKDVRQALHWFAVLSRKGNPPAQAFLADLYWRGKYVPHDPKLALGLINIAVDNAPAEDRVWIEDLHQNIFCGATGGVRQEATGLVLSWRKTFGRPRAIEDRIGLSSLDATAVRSCRNGEVVQRVVANPASSGVNEASVAAISSRPAGPSLLAKPEAGGAVPGVHVGEYVPQGDGKFAAKDKSPLSILFGGMTFPGFLKPEPKGQLGEGGEQPSAARPTSIVK